MTQEIPGIDGWFWADDLDLSALSYPQFLDFFFDRPIVGNKEQYNLFHGGIDYFAAEKPAIVVAHVHAMCQSLSELTKIYSQEQLNQGLWAVFGAGTSCEQYLFDPAVDLHLRINCIESMYQPFRDIVAKSSLDKKESFYWMWWDMILQTFWITFRETDDNYDALTRDAKRLVDAMYETLLKILALDHPACQWSALHGLGHLHHPEARETVQRYLDTHRANLCKKKWNGLKVAVTGQTHSYFPSFVCATACAR